jgi:hypothetical protein
VCITRFATVEARWFTRAEVSEQFGPRRPDSIESYLIEEWLLEGD